MPDPRLLLDLQGKNIRCYNIPTEACQDGAQSDESQESLAMPLLLIDIH